MPSTTIEISKEYLHFAAAHFTIFSKEVRENLHGHNFFVAAQIDAEIGDDGLTFDYNLIKSKLKSLCDTLDEQVLLPTNSPYLELQSEDGYIVAAFNGERLPFLARDVLTLPLRNITIEELAHWFIGELKADPEIAALEIRRINIKVSSGAGQWASADDS
ncbi:MAG: 6-carboxytetrahydropterin synthase [Gammaproteobacteria bacterium]|nr:6-carboxytetrahydropterin synthase [Gammaproteobacteria bacterium]